MLKKTTDSINLSIFIVGLVFPIAIWLFQAVLISTTEATPYDTEYTYLPIANSILQSSLAIWNDVDILKTAPGAAVYMALAGAEISKIYALNFLLGLFSLVLIFNTGQKIGSVKIGIIGCWLYAISPTLAYWTVYPMGEPVYFFFIYLWIWACAWTSALDSENKWTIATSIFIAGLALTCAILTRATYMLWLPLAMVIFGLFSTFSKKYLNNLALAKIFKRYVIIHLIASICVGAYIFKNIEKFNFPSVAVGAGNALYLGSNPVFFGQEPVYFDVMWDNLGVTKGISPLTIEGDKILREKAESMLTQLPKLTIAEIYVNKAATLLFGSRTHLENYAQRAWRIVLIIMAAVGVAIYWRNPITLLIAGATTYQWLVHIPVLYNQRYSAGALDIGLMLLASIGIWKIWGAQLNRKNRIIFSITSIVIGVVLGAAHQRYSSPPLPNLALAPHQKKQTALPDELSFDGLTSNPFEKLSTSPSGKFGIYWKSSNFSLYSVYILRLGVQEIQGNCSRAWLTYVRPNGSSSTSKINIQGFRTGQDFTWGLNSIGFSSDNPKGDILLNFECSQNTQIKIDGFEIYDATPTNNYPLIQK